MNDEIKINKIQLACDLAKERTIDFFDNKYNMYAETKMYNKDEQDMISYTEEAQKIFDNHYCHFLELIENCEVK